MKRLSPVLILALISIILLSSCIPKTFEFKGDYAVITSRILYTQGMIWDIDSSGNIINNKKMKIQDIATYDMNNEYFIAGGNRKNTNIVIDKSGSIIEISLLNDKKYTGVTHITMYNDIIVGIMNNGPSDIGVYETYLILQDLNGNIIHKEFIELYVNDSIIVGNELILVGRYSLHSEIPVGSIIKFNLDTLELISQTHYPEYTRIMNIIEANNNYFIISKYQDGPVYKPDTITILNKNLTIKQTFSYNESLYNLLKYNDNVYVILKDEIHKYTTSMGLIEKLPIPSDHNIYASQTLIYDNSLYFVGRIPLEYITDDIDGCIYGYIYNINLDNFQIEQKTKVQFKDDSTINHILIFPTAFIDK